MKGTTNLTEETLHSVSLYHILTDENSRDIGLQFHADGEIFALSPELALNLAHGLADAILRED